MFKMSRTKMFAALLAALFVSAVGMGVWLGWDDRPEREVAVVDVSTTTTTVARTTTTTRVSTTTTRPPTTTTTRPPATTVATTVTTDPPATDPPATDPPVTEPTTTAPSTTAGLGYDPVLCARIRSTYSDLPTRHALLQLNSCPPHYFD